MDASDMARGRRLVRGRPNKSVEDNGCSRVCRLYVFGFSKSLCCRQRGVYSSRASPDSLGHMNSLAEEIAKFKKWAELYRQPNYAGPRDYGAEWECDYQHWQEIYVAVEELLESAARRSLTDSELELLLFALARDNEDENILELLEKYPSAASQIAKAALGYIDKDARWQAAVLLGRIRAPDSASLLKRFLTDEVEYVRRRAGFALEELEATE